MNDKPDVLSRPTFTWPVNIPRPVSGGKQEIKEMEFKFRALRKSQLRNLRKDNTARMEVKDADVDEVLLDSILTYTADWAGVGALLPEYADHPFGREALEALAEEYPAALNAIAFAYNGAMSGEAAVKNS